LSDLTADAHIYLLMLSKLLSWVLQYFHKQVDDLQWIAAGGHIHDFNLTV